jgi:2-amino-4-hydroxy-6-hydroxymethyldihydropteridine diphosphokinase
MSIVYLGIGSNLGNREGNCKRALELIENKGILIRKKSSLYETVPWGIKDQPLFLNMVIAIETELRPKELLKVLQDLETEVGRVKSFKWGPRKIDLDILLYDDLIFHDDTLTIPHPLMHKRDFVLRPLHEIAPDVKHPLLKLTAGRLLQELRDTEKSHGIS